MTDETENGGKPDFSYLKALHFKGVEKDLEAGRYISAPDLARLIRSRGDVPIPDRVLEYACAHLAGEVARPKGRPAHEPISLRIRKMIISAEYLRLLGVFEESSLSPEDIEEYGSEDNPHDEARTPAERAARLVAARFWDGAESWRTVQNISSEYKRSQE
jgi:hypothetical protein